MRVIEKNDGSKMSAVYECEIENQGVCVLKKVWHEKKRMWKIENVKTGYIDYNDSFAECLSQEKRKYKVFFRNYNYYEIGVDEVEFRNASYSTLKKEYENKDGINLHWIKDVKTGKIY